VLLEIDRSVVRLEAGAGGVKIPNRIMVASAGVEEKYIVTSDGAKVESRVPRFNYFGILTAMKGGDAAQRMIQQGETGGLEIVKRIRLVELVEEEAQTLMEVLGEAVKAPTGMMDVVL
jgi:predicted Zn-dependent protease